MITHKMMSNIFMLRSTMQNGIFAQINSTSIVIEDKNILENNTIIDQLAFNP